MSELDPSVIYLGNNRLGIDVSEPQIFKDEELIGTWSKYHQPLIYRIARLCALNADLTVRYEAVATNMWASRGVPLPNGWKNNIHVGTRELKKLVGEDLRHTFINRTGLGIIGLTEPDNGIPWPKEGPVHLSESGSVAFHQREKLIRVGDRVIWDIRNSNLAVAEALLQSPGTPMSLAELSQKTGYKVTPHTLTALRSNLGDPDLLKNIRNAGYQIV